MTEYQQRYKILNGLLNFLFQVSINNAIVDIYDEIDSFS